MFETRKQAAFFVEAWQAYEEERFILLYAGVKQKQEKSICIARW